MKNANRIALTCWTLITSAVWLSPAYGDEVRLNQIQVIGTHNSYHIAPHKAVLDLIAQSGERRGRSLDYTHRPLQTQLGKLGIRQIELDVYADPKGGLFAKPFAARNIPDAAQHDPKGLLDEPGLKVLHIPDVDFRTTALTLLEALHQVRAWSQENSDHCPVMIMIEVKQGSRREEYAQLHPFGTAEMDAIDTEILSVFGPNEILKPDDVRGDSDTLRDAVTSRGWPPLNDVRGKVMFAMDNGGDVRDLYMKGHETLRDRLLFVSVEETHPAAAFMKINDAVGDFETIQKMVKKGFLVRTRADAGTKESRLNDTGPREKAFASGAQFISTDYPEPDRRFSGYQVRFKGNVIARANPVNGKPEWHDRDFDDVAGLPSIDGIFSEWREEHLLARDPKGDATASFDVTELAARTNNSQLFLHFDIGHEINLQNGADSDGTLRLVVELSDQRQLTIDFRKRTATLDAQPVAWSQLDFACLPTYASDKYELQLDLDEFGLHEGDTIKLNFSGSDKLDEPVSVVLDKGEVRRPDLSLARTDRDGIRIANLNTFRQGLSDATRSESIKRLLAATAADIFCFEEETEEARFREAAPRIVPADKSKSVNLHWFGGCGIASSLRLEPLPMTLDRGAAALVELPHSGHVTVVVVHLECCGYADSREDQTRVRQARQLVGQIQRLRDGDFGEKPKHAGIVIVGDYNLVGSRKPLDMLRNARLTDVLMRAPAHGATYTWRGITKEESFWPGRLDLVMYGSAVLKPLNGYVLDTSRLSKESLASLRLRTHDSLVSDHLLMVADFVPVP